MLAAVVKIKLGQCELLIQLVEILEEIHCWRIKLEDLYYFAILQTLLTYNNSTILVAW